MTAPFTAPEPIELSVGVEGMTCASCVNRIERFLRNADGVTAANVNLATERATVSLDPTIAGRAEVVAAIEAAGYDVRPERSTGQTTALTLDDADPDADLRAREMRALGLRALVSVAVAVAIMALMLWPGGLGMSMTELNWLLLIPATFVQFWAGGIFMRNALRQGRHGTVSMDTLVALGTMAAWGYSVVVTLLPSLVVDAGIEPVTYFDSSSIDRGTHPRRSLDGSPCQVAGERRGGRPDRPGGTYRPASGGYDGARRAHRCHPPRRPGARTTR